MQRFHQSPMVPKILITPPQVRANKVMTTYRHSSHLPNFWIAMMKKQWNSFLCQKHCSVRYFGGFQSFVDPAYQNDICAQDASHPGLHIAELQCALKVSYVSRYIETAHFVQGSETSWARRFWEQGETNFPNFSLKSGGNEPNISS